MDDDNQVDNIENTYFCCDKVFKTLIVFKMHKAVKHTKDEKLQDILNLKETKPKIVPMTKQYRKAYQRSRRQTLSLMNVEPEFKMCSYCGKNFRSGYIKAHIKGIHNGENVKCSKCDFTSRNKNTIWQHNTIVHTDKMKEICGFCGEVFKKLKWHLKVSMCGKEKDDRERFPCDICGKISIGDYGLKKHMKQMHGEKTFQCKSCTYASSSSFNLRLHVTKVHERSSMNPEKCLNCEKKTTNMKLHKKIYHNDIYIPTT